MSATMLDSFDSPMLDYQNDHDIPMQTNSDPWYQHEEHAMEDEVHDDASHVSIEVEMEGYDEQGNPEYEMVDTDEHFDVHIQEPIDVEFHDASNNPSPYHQSLSIPDDPIASATRTEATFHAVAKPPTPLPLSPQRSAEENTMVESPFPFSADVEQTFVLEEETLIHHESVKLSTDHADPESTIQKDVSSHSPELQLAEPTAVQETQHDPIEERHDRAIVTGETPAPSAPISRHISPAVADNESTVNEHRSEVVAVQAEHDDDVASSAVANAAAADTRDDLAKEEVHQENAAAETAEEPANYDNVSSAASSGDPHEISEGVYIDPPPPVLVSFTLEVPPVALFNVPSDSPSTSYAPELVVLLGDQPTLYYEPLSSVFEALRQEEHLHNITGLLNGELVLNAYDLDLVLSEDYTFTQELTLHDLSVLHDGLHKPGPLRVQLKNSGPRFLDRYHALQQEVQQLELSVSQGGAGTYPEQLNQLSNENQAEHPLTIDNEATQDLVPPTNHEEKLTHIVKPLEVRSEDNLAEVHSEELADDIPPPPEDDEDDDPALLEEAAQIAIVEQGDGASHAAIDLENVDASQATVNQDQENDGDSEEVVQSGKAAPHEMPQSVSEEHVTRPDSHADNGILSSKDDARPGISALELKEPIEAVETHQAGPEDAEHELTGNADELNLEFEEIYDEDDQSATLSNEDIHEQEDDVAHAHDAESASYEDSREDGWDEEYEDHEDRKESSIHEDTFLQESTSKLHRAQSFGSSKRSISEAELEDFDDSDVPLSTSPGSKRLRTE